MSFIFLWFEVNGNTILHNNKHVAGEKKVKSIVAMKAECVVFLPGRASRSESKCVVVTMTFAQAAVLCNHSLENLSSHKLNSTNLCPNASESMSFMNFVYWVNNPVNPWITVNLKYKHSKKLSTSKHWHCNLNGHTALWLGSTKMIS